MDLPMMHQQDPTELTTKQLHREVEVLHDHLEVLFEGLEKLIQQRFSGVERQFELVERMRVEQKADTKAAVDAALTAQKEAVKEQTTASDRAIAKSETAMTKQLEQLNGTFTAAIKGVTDLLSETKDRVSKVEANKTGAGEAVATTRSNLSGVVSIVGIVLSFIALSASVIISLTR